MGRTPQETLAIEKRRQQVAELYLRSNSQAQIAMQLGVSQPTVSADLQAIRRQWRESTERDFSEAMDLQLAKLDHVEREAWAAWERSKQPRESTRVVSDGTDKRAEKLTRHQPGDPRYLEIVQRAIAARNALLGLEAPMRIAPTSPNGKEAYGSHVIGQLMQLAEQTPPGPQVIDAQFVDREVERLAAGSKSCKSDPEEQSG